MTWRLSDRVKILKPSPTLAMAAKAKKLALEGHPVISLSVGEPDWDTFDFIKQGAIREIQAGNTKYAPSSGLPDLREAISSHLSKKLALPVKADQVTISAGAKFILFSAVQSLINEGDEALVFAPYWVSYPDMIQLAGGSTVVVPPAGAGGQPGLASLRSAISPRLRLIFLNSPNNPSGYVWSEQELKLLAEILRENPDVVVVSDDIYSRLCFSYVTAPHLLSVAPDLWDRCLIVDGASKSYSMTGWRVGWGVGPKDWIQAMSNFQSQSVSCAAPFAQAATLLALRSGESEIASKVEILRKRRDFFVSGLRSVKGLSVESPGGAFYVWVNCSALLGRSWRGVRLEGSRDFCEALLQAQMVASVPGIESGVEGYVRMSFALGEHDLQEALRRIQAFVQSLE